MNYTKLLLVPALSLGLALSGPVIAMSHSGDNQVKHSNCQCKNKHQKMKKMMETLNLTEQQKQQITDIKDKYKGQMKDLYKQKRELKKQMYDVVNTDSMDQQKMNGLVDQMKGLYGEKIKLKLNMKHDVYQVLTPEQREQVAGMMKNKTVDENNQSDQESTNDLES